MLVVCTWVTNTRIIIKCNATMRPSPSATVSGTGGASVTIISTAARVGSSALSIAACGRRKR